MVIIFTKISAEHNYMGSERFKMVPEIKLLIDHINHMIKINLTTAHLNEVPCFCQTSLARSSFFCKRQLLCRNYKYALWIRNAVQTVQTLNVLCVEELARNFQNANVQPYFGEAFQHFVGDNLDAPKSACSVKVSNDKRMISDARRCSNGYAFRC